MGAVTRSDDTAPASAARGASGAVSVSVLLEFVAILSISFGWHIVAGAAMVGMILAYSVGLRELAVVKRSFRANSAQPKGSSIRMSRTTDSTGDLPRVRTLSTAGMFDSGYTDTAERAEELLHGHIDD